NFIYKVFFHTTVGIILWGLPCGLFRSTNKKEHWNPCELYRGGKCRAACGHDEIQYLSCLPDLKCCLKISTYLTNSDPNSSSPVANTSSSAPS
uniref:Beta-defensin n=1 Tax=Urocitellus parryii TaxID=9999 RepID=A0A8D2KME7_UROPR